MGKNPWGWVCEYFFFHFGGYLRIVLILATSVPVPIGKPEADGLEYPTNPRFTPDGRWRQRAEWPAELR